MFMNHSFPAFEKLIKFSVFTADVGNTIKFHSYNILSGTLPVRNGQFFLAEMFLSKVHETGLTLFSR